jgi:hypothetical protein
MSSVSQDIDQPRALARQQAKRSSITCRACGLGATVPLDHPALLCPPCLEDLNGTRERHAMCLQTALEGLEVNQANWEAQRAASPAQLRWAAVQAALIGVAEKRADQRVFDATWAKRKAEGGPLAQLLLAYEAYARECDRIGEELARLYAAQREINVAWLNTPMEESEPRMPRPNEYAVPDDATPTTCRSCGAGMVFIKTAQGKALPLSVATIEVRDGVRYALPHFADCPNSKEWSKK